MSVVIAGFACITETLPEIYDSVMTSLALPDYPPRTMKEGPMIMRRYIISTHAPEQLHSGNGQEIQFIPGITWARRSSSNI